MLGQLMDPVGKMLHALGQMVDALVQGEKFLVDEFPGFAVSLTRLGRGPGPVGLQLPLHLGEIPVLGLLFPPFLLEFLFLLLVGLLDGFPRFSHLLLGHFGIVG